MENKDGVPAEVREALNNIKATLKIEASRGNKEAAWVLRHL